MGRFRHTIYGDIDTHTWEHDPRRRAMQGGLGSCNTGSGGRVICVLNGIGCDVDHVTIARLTIAAAQRATEPIEITQEPRGGWDSMPELVLVRSLDLKRLHDIATYHRHKADEWLTAYQRGRCKHVGDYTRLFVRRPRLRKLVGFLIRL